MPDILVNFVSDTSGLDPSIDGMDKLAAKDAQLAESVKNTTAAVDARNKSLSDSAKASTKDTAALVTAFDKLSKSAAGGLYDKAVKQLGVTLKGTNDEFKILSATIDTAKAKLATLSTTSDEFKELSDNVEAGEEILKTFGNTTTETENRTISLKQELRALKEEIALKLQNGESGPELDSLIERAGELDDSLKDVNKTVSQTGSDTKNIEGFTALLGTAAQTISGVTAAQSLLGDSSDDYQKALVKLNALLVLSNSIQSVQTQLLRDSAAVTAVESAQRKLAALSTQLQVAAESELTVVRYGAIAAQRILNFVMAQNPIGIVVIALGTLAAAILVFTSRTTDAARSQRELNEVLFSANDGLESYLTGIEAANGRAEAALKARGASDKELTANEINNINLRNAARTEELEKLRDVYNKVQILDEEGRKSKAEVGKKIIELENDITKDQITAINSRAEFERQSYLNSLKSATAFAEARISLAKKNSAEELAANIAAARARQTEQLSSDPNITAGARKKIEADTEKEIFELRFDYEKRALQNAKDSIDQKLIYAKKGSDEELDYTLESLRLQRDIDEKELGQSVERKKLIDQKYLRERGEAILAFNRKQAEDNVNTDISDVNQQLSILQVNNVEETNGKVIELKKRLIDDQAALEVISIGFTEKNEELRNKKIAEAYAVALSLKKKLDDDVKRETIENDFSYSQKKYDLEVLYNQKIILDDKSTNAQRKTAEMDLAKFSQLSQENELTRLERLHSDKLITEKEYQDSSLQLQIDAEQQRIQLLQQRQQMEQQLGDQEFDLASKLNSAIFDIDSGAYQRDVDANQKRFDDKLISQTEFNNRKAELDRQQAQREKDKAVFDIAIGLAKTIFDIQSQALILGSNPLTQALVPLALNQIPIAIAAAAIETGAILAKKYRFGGVIDGPGNGTSDSVPIWASKGEYMVRYEQSAKHREALEAINKDRFDDYLRNVEAPKFFTTYSMPVLPDAYKNYQVNTSTAAIDYDKLGHVVAREIAKNPQTKLSFDERGLTLFFIQQHEQVQYLNKKLDQ
jgi:hypothetical protein